MEGVFQYPARGGVKVKVPIWSMLAIGLVAATGCSSAEPPSAPGAPVESSSSVPSIPQATDVSPSAGGVGGTATVAPVDAAITATSVAGPFDSMVFIGDVAFAAEIADDPGERAQGLSGGDALGDKTGMLFVYETGVAGSIWMKGMSFPLDLVWIGADCTVVDITFSAAPPPPGASFSELTVYRSSISAAYTFEINGGEATALGIAVGDPVRFSGVEASAGQRCE